MDQIERLGEYLYLKKLNEKGKDTVYMQGYKDGIEEMENEVIEFLKRTN